MRTRTSTSGGWSWSNHAYQRTVEMGLTCQQVEQVLDSPDMTYPNKHRDRRTQRIIPGTVYVGGGLAIPVSPQGTIMTVLWHRKEGRHEEEA